ERPPAGHRLRHRWRVQPQAAGVEGHAAGRQEHPREHDNQRRSRGDTALHRARGDADHSCWHTADYRRTRFTQHVAAYVAPVKAVVLVGGEGTRLRPLTYKTPKQLLPVALVPMIERVVAHLAGHGVDHVVLSMG